MNVLPGVGVLTKLLPYIIPWLSSNHEASPYRTACLSLKSGLHLENTTITRVSYVVEGSTVSTPGPCTANTGVVASVCRVEFTTRTSEASSVRAEAWLPDEWHGRFLGLGNGGLAGCIDYTGLNYGSKFHFASVASNNGHDGDSGAAFSGNPEAINDFAFRAIHIEAVVGKQIVEEYYKQPQSKSYYMGCSTGGRQGTRAALSFPEDFDGIIAGAPATNFNHLIYWSGITANNLDAALIPLHTWRNIIAPEILRQCDWKDGVLDGIITEPDNCDFKPESLLCRGTMTRHCLTHSQIYALHKLYSPLFVDGELVCPRFDPGAERDAGSFALLSGEVPSYTVDWLRYAVLNDSTFDIRTLKEEHLRIMDKINPGAISTFSGDLAAFRDRGGKFITYHGRMDPLIVSGNSKRYYDLVSQTMGDIDDFYRLFLVPGMGHCVGGPGATRFGQHGAALGVRNDREHNILLALVDWVENGVTPDTIIGVGDRGKTRRHCRYPHRSVWNGLQFVCQ
ncbi:Carboxylic ester hydrolase [Mycena indigotica]|uniref:Carboxylic ester hydrolase n=1 Tax=Mycena indigotica TaxID=2126181 RepID=A0A8H6RZT8_9AGAR|nr:Carboxylic ester hydrolase [Mycena indigotica]KAF7289867.1 Carboxylic ester hydrolase [Mycena indigotica]